MKSPHHPAYTTLRIRLEAARTKAGLTQQALAEKLGRPQSFVSKIESGDLRLDVLEYVEWMLAVEMESGTIVSALESELMEQGRRRRLLAKR